MRTAFVRPSAGTLGVCSTHDVSARHAFVQAVPSLGADSPEIATQRAQIVG